MAGGNAMLPSGESGTILAPPSEIVPPDPEAATREIGERYQAIEDSFTESAAHPFAYAIAEGSILSQDVQVLPSTEPGRPFVIATHYLLSVSRSWKLPLPKTIDVWSKGGVLPNAYPIGDYPRGQHTSTEAYFKDGEDVIVVLAHADYIGGNLLTHPLNGQLGVLPATLPMTAPPEVRAVIADCRAYLAANFPAFEVTQ